MFVPATKSPRLFSLCFFVAVSLLLLSCASVREYQARKPFVYRTNIELAGKFSTDERKDLEARLDQQLHDSVRARWVQKLILWKTLRKPPVFDSLNADKSVLFMRDLLNSLGYYRDTITYDTSLAVKGDQYRTTVNFRVVPGRLIRIDSIAFSVAHDTLQQITLNAQNETLLKKGQPFAKALIASELNRLVDVYRNNGFLSFSLKNLIAEWDTVGLALLRPTLDPIEQAELLQELQRRRENPTASLEIRLRPSDDSAHLTRYYVGNVSVYPDLTADTSSGARRVQFRQNYRIISYWDAFKPRVLTENIYLRKGDLYSQRNYLRTSNRFQSLPAWRLVTIEQQPRPGTDTADFVIRLTPARKYSFNANLEGSQNWGYPFSEGNLLGLGVNFSLQNRNFAHGANSANTTFRFGTELSTRNEFVRTKQFNFGHNITFPRMVPNIGWVPARIKENVRTIFALNLGNTDRVDYFNVRTLNTSWGYEFSWKNKILGFRFPNIEYAFLQVRDTLAELIRRNPSYRYIFTNGLISSAIGNLTITNSRINLTTQTRFNLEGSGLLTGFVHNKFMDENLYRFIKLDAEYKQTYKIYNRSEFAWRIFSGVGYALPSTRNRNDRYLPFFRQYYGGGPNSMRAWALRKLGPGSTVQPFGSTGNPDRFGDIQFETNGEYRFPIINLAGIQINSALFTDIGNVWFLRDDPDQLNENFELKRFVSDLAVGVGTGLRIDFGLFMVRLDYAFKAKDPAPAIQEAQNKWFYNWKPLKGQLQLGINYPF